MAQVIPLMSQSRAELVQRRNNSAVPALWAMLDDVKDPEIPVLSIWELGILQDITSQQDQVTVVITPTYSGCPAMDQIATDIKARMAQGGYINVTVKLSLSPAWTSDWLDNSARAALRQYGIAPPLATQATQLAIVCPHCGSNATSLISEFGSTSCKALYKCRDCAEPFDYFKSL